MKLIRLYKNWHELKLGGRYFLFNRQDNSYDLATIKNITIDRDFSSTEQHYDIAVCFSGEYKHYNIYDSTNEQVCQVYVADIYLLETDNVQNEISCFLTLQELIS